MDVISKGREGVATVTEGAPTSSMKNLVHTTTTFIAQGPFIFTNKMISFLTNRLSPR
jgi:hypothetical protein